MRVLIFEDDALVACMLESIVVEEGHEVAALAGDTATAIDVGVAASPDLAFVDYVLADGPMGVRVAQSGGIAALADTPTTVPPKASTYSGSRVRQPEE